MTTTMMQLPQQSAIFGLVDEILAPAVGGLFVSRLNSGGAAMWWKAGATVDLTLRIVQEGRQGLCQLIVEKSQVNGVLESGLQLFRPSESDPTNLAPTPLEELRRRHALWAMVVAKDHHQSRLYWSGDLVTCLGLMAYAEQAVRELLK